MAATASTVRAAGQYRRLQNESRAESADPVELVTMLYDELETAVGVLAADGLVRDVVGDEVAAGHKRKFLPELADREVAADGVEDDAHPVEAHTADPGWLAAEDHAHGGGRCATTERTWDCGLPDTVR